MSAWKPAGSGGGGRQFYGTGQGAPSTMGGVYQPTVSGGAGEVEVDSTPGVISVNPLDPKGTAESAGQGIGDLFAGLRTGLFGTDTLDSKGSHGGLLGDIPVVGDLTRGVSAIPGAVGTGISRIPGAIVSGLEHLPSPGQLLPGGSDELEAKYAALPEEYRAEAQKLMDEEKGLLGTGLFDNDGHIKHAALQKYADDQQFENPTLFGGKFVAPGSLADAVGGLMDLLGASAATAERGAAGLKNLQGNDRLDQAIALASGQYASTGVLGTGLFAGEQKASPVEQLAVAKVANGDWTRDEALDFLATHGAGWSHDAGLELASSVLGDPLNVATFGAGALAKAGTSGATFLARAERAASLLEETNTSLRAAEEVAQAAKGAKAIKAAAAEVERLQAEVGTLEKSVKAFSSYTGTKAPRGINVLGRATQGSEKAADFLKLAGKVYGGLEGTSLGKAAKVTRTIIDPLHAIDLHMPGTARLVDLYSDALPKTLVTTMGPQHHMAILEDLTKLDATGVLRDQFSRDLATAVANRGREGVADLYRAGQMEGGLGTKLGQVGLDEVLEEAIAATKEKDLLRWLRYDVVKNVLIRDWSTEARTALANQLEALYHVRDAAAWLKRMETMSVEELSLWKHAAYGNSNRKLLEGIANSVTHPSAATFDLNRMVLLAKSTLTRLGADSLTARLLKTKKLADKVKLIEEWQAKYPQLRYITMDPANPGTSVEKFTEWLGGRIDSLPMQVKNDELASLHPDLQELQTTLGDGYSLGFRPKDEFLWGIERSNAEGGGWRVATAPWVDHVADGGLGYRPGRALTLNLVGHPIVDGPVRAAAKALDYMEMGARVLKAQVSGAQITEVARGRFVSEASRGKFAAGGLSETVADHMWERIQDYTRAHQGYSGPRGFGAGDLYDDLFKQRLIPQPLLNGSVRLTERDVLQMVLNAYDGDIRYIGLTQKLTGRAKAMVYERFGTNFLGQIAEHAWPLMKFRYNPIFQLQEKIEPWVLNAQRGVPVAFRSSLSEADAATERLLQRLTDNSVIRQADLDQAEYSAQVLHGKALAAVAGTAGTKAGKMKTMASTILDVQGVKRLNMIRTFRAGLGKELRGVWETSNPGVWDDMKELADVRAGRIIDEDEFALQLMGEQLYSNDIVISRLGRTTSRLADASNAIKTGAWHTPSHLGELQPLDLGHVAGSLRLPGADGEEIRNLADLRKYVAEDASRVRDVEEGLRRLGADPDYVQRVTNSLTFSWTGFWKTAGERFALTSEESRSLQDMVAGAAEMRGMQPTDFMSQVFAPGIKDGTEGLLGSLAGAKDLRAVLAGKTGVSTRADLVKQMSAVFADYLDPSAKRALLMEFKPELRQAVLDGRVKLDLADLKTMWDSEATDSLADRIVGYMDGKVGSGAHDLVDDEARGVAAARKSATAYMEKHGVTPQSERRYYALDEPLYEDSARAYSALPETPFERTGRVPRFDTVNKAGLDLKPRPTGVDERTYEAYGDFVADTRAQWDHITAPKAKGGLGLRITVSKTDPYPSSAAMRADVAKGRLRVLGTDSDHPLMTNEQNVMFRAVHDVFGHAAEGFEFGPRGELNAAAKHSQMYSDTGRAAMLTETHGQTSWVNYSDDPIPGAGEFVPAETWNEARAAYRAAFADVADVAVDNGPLSLVWDYETSLGQGIDLLANNGLETEMTELVTTVHGLRAQFPNVPLPHIDAADLDDLLMQPGVSGVAIGAPQGKTAIIFNEKMWTDPNFAQRSLQGEAEFGQIEPGSVFSGGGETMFRHTDKGAPWARGAGEPMAVVYHEYGHAIDTWLRYGKAGIDEDVLQPYLDFADDFTDMTGAAPAWMKKALKQTSEYARTSDEEGMAELLGIALNPKVERATLQPELRRAVEELEGHLDAVGVRAKPAPAGTVREANAAKRGSVYAPQKAALLPQAILDRFGEAFVGTGKHVESNPDVARTAQMFGKWSSKVVENGLLKGEQSIHSGLLHDVAGIPTKDAVPYNFTEGLMLQQANAAMADKWRDAFRLQYFAQERSMLERSVNHPMFGLYPASYMWGKIAPEVIQFVAQRPFGLRTGGLAYTLTDAQAQIALQREFDPKFDKKIEDLGHSQAMSFLGYMLPALPWEVSASAPIWMKDIASEGLRSQSQVDAGGEAEGFNAVKPVVDVVGKLNPLAQTLPWAARAAGEVTSGEDKQDLANLAQEPTQGASLSPQLTLVMQELREALAK